MKLVPEGWRWPRIVTHIVDHPSTTVTFGFMLFLTASVAAFILAKIGAEMWLWCVVLSSILIGGVKVSKSILEAMQMKLGGAKPADLVKEVKPDAVPVADPPK